MRFAFRPLPPLVHALLHGLLPAALVLGLLVGWTGAVLALTDLERAQANPDFAVQGEYQGSLALDGRRDVPVGLQIVAQGDRQFAAVFFEGGLPGAGWKPSTGRRHATGKTSDGRTEFHCDDWNAVLLDGKLMLSAADGTAMGTLTKVDRESPTLGQMPPPGAIVLFDGTSAEQWIGGRVTAEHTLAAGAVTKISLRDFAMHLEFCLPFMPRARGQQRANSGVYLQNRYEVQVLDSFGLDGQSNECGGIYSVRAPDVNMCFPPLEWQTYDIDFTAARFDARQTKTHAARVTVTHNGVVIHDDVEIARPTAGGLVSEHPAEGPLQLQWHLSAVTYRNIWLQERNSSAEK
ncbi:MAG TPA: DUF1080 domain-containing protein [Pirellulales bacterium]|jgi:hypothetical protein|nr:DUF1080 domain-containing protein [Pirellulales bacterium]